MDASIEKYWALRVQDCGKALEKNNFDVFIADDIIHAKHREQRKSSGLCDLDVVDRGTIAGLFPPFHGCMSAKKGDRPSTG